MTFSIRFGRPGTEIRNIRTRWSSLLLGVTIGVLLISLGCGQSVAQLPPNIGDPVFFVSRNGVVLQGHVSGKGDIWVVLLTASTERPRDWVEFTDFLVGNGYKTLTFDQGIYSSQDKHNQSDVDRIVDGGHGALAYIENIDPGGSFLTYVIGSGVGGSAAIELAGTRLLLGLIALSPPYYPPLDHPMIDETSLPVGKLFIASEGNANSLTDVKRYFDDSVPPRMVEIYAGDERGVELVNGQHADRLKTRVIEFLEAYGP